MTVEFFVYAYNSFGHWYQLPYTNVVYKGEEKNIKISSGCLYYSICSGFRNGVL